MVYLKYLNVLRDIKYCNPSIFVKRLNDKSNKYKRNNGLDKLNNDNLDWFQIGL